MPFFSTRVESGVLVITFDDPSGLSDMSTDSPRDSLVEAVQDASVARVAIDMGPVDYLSSSGIGVLVGLNRRLEARSGKLVLFGMQTGLTELLQVMNLNQYFVIAASDSEALALLRPLPAD